MRKSVRLKMACAIVTISGIVFLPAFAGADQFFGSQGRADAARRAIIVAVQQGISSLPPTSGQSFVYEYDPELSLYKRSAFMGPFSFRSPQTVGKGKFSFRSAASYFELNETLGPIDYQFNFDPTLIKNLPDSQKTQFGRFGAQFNTKVGLINLGVNYGILDELEVTFNLPIAIVDAQASEIETHFPDQPPGTLGLALSRADLENSIKDGAIVLEDIPFQDIGGVNFNDGTHVGVGRISLGAKYTFLSQKAVQLAFSTEFFFPSPNENQFAGSESAAILPRLIGAATLTDFLRLHMDAGYDYDFSRDELRRFTWNTGFSVPISIVTLDFGVGGSLFNTGVRWTPENAEGYARSSDPGILENPCGVAGSPTNPDGSCKPDTSIHALQDTRLGTNFIDALAGFKVKVSENVVLSGGVNVPITNDGLRPVAAGTGAVEVYF